jgi:DNA replication initiation complex subunit (GINS family)
MKLSSELAMIFESEIEKVIQKEREDISYLPQEQFANSDRPCFNRADKMVTEATALVIKTLGLAIAEHRTEKHGEDNTDEMVTLEADLSEKQIDVAARGWWNG